LITHLKDPVRFELRTI